MKASPVFDAVGNAYFATIAGAVSSYTPDGGVRWRVQMETGASGSPALDPSDRSLFLGTLGGEACALDTFTGKIVWRRRIPSHSDPRILSDLLFLPDRNLVVLNSWGGQFCALDADTGALRLTWSAGICSYASAAASQDGIIFGLRTDHTEDGSGLLCFLLDPDSDKETALFFQPVESRVANRITVATSPIIDDARKRLYFIANVECESKLYAFCLLTRKILWSKDFRRFILGTPALLADGSIAVADSNGVLHIISHLGSLHHRYHTGAYYLLAGPVCDQEGSIFVGDPEGRLHVVSPDGVGKVIFEGPRSIESRPAFDPEGRLYLASRAGQVFVFPHRLG